MAYLNIPYSLHNPSPSLVPAALPFDRLAKNLTVSAWAVQPFLQQNSFEKATSAAGFYEVWMMRRQKPLKD